MRDMWGKDFCIPNEDAIRRFATIINDTNPIHHDNRAARARGLHGIIAPGVMVSGWISATIAEEVPGVMVRCMQMEFKEPIYAGSLITVFCRVLRLRRVSADIFVTVNLGFRRMAEGSCTLLLPPADAIH